MKRFIAIVMMCFTLFTCLAGCSTAESLTNENFYCKILDENNIAIGGLKTYPKDGAVFFPERIENYTVSKIGFASGMGFGGHGYLSTSKEGEPNIQRCYFPHTINKVDSGYTGLVGTLNLKIFYCGAVIDLVCLDDQHRDTEIYVPAEKYDLFKNVLLEKYFGGSLLKANVSYHLNYGEDNYYYIDYYENGEKICYIPPIPQRDGYTFGGWFKEAECISQWNFDPDTLQLSEEAQEIKLYAKWIVEQ